MFISFGFLLRRARTIARTTTTITIAIAKPERYRTLLLAIDGDCVGEDEGLVVGVIVGVEDGFEDGDGELVGASVATGVGVGVGALAKLAVIVPGPFIVATVEEPDGISNEMLLELADHEENW